MPYIVVDFQGQATAGGYLKVDGGKQIMLTDDMMIEVSVGTHYLEFSSQSSAQRGMSKLNAAVGNYNVAAWSEKDAVDGKITVDFPRNSSMLFTVVSDRSGHILDLPQYHVDVFSDEEYSKLEDIYREKLSKPAAHHEHAKKMFWLCFFLGSFGVHRFYIGEIGRGLLYLITGGLFGLGWLYDTIVLLRVYLQSRPQRK